MRLSKILFIAILFFLLSPDAGARKNPKASATEQKGYALLDASLLSAHLHFLASDALEGRETGLHGQKIAAEYIASNFKRLGLKALGKDGSYFQEFSVCQSCVGIENKILVYSQTNDAQSAEPTAVWDGFLQDFYFFPRRFSASDTLSGEVVFLGYGIHDESEYDYSDYKNMDVEGKIVLVMHGEPQRNDSSSIFNGVNPTRWSRNSEKRAAAIDAGVKALLIVSDQPPMPPVKEQAEAFASYITQSSVNLATAAPDDEFLASPLPPSIYISTEIANSLLVASGKKLDELQAEIDRTGKPLSFQIENTRANIVIDIQKEILKTENVCAMIEGCEEKDEAVVVCGHYDHLGIDRRGNIYNGADDNGSGSAAVLSLAEAFARNGIKPRRSIIFMLFSGEEKGLLGSKHFVSKPMFPLENIVADVNLDMVGRSDRKHEASGETDYVYAIGSDKISLEYDRLLREANQASVNLELDYTFNREDDPNRFYYRSDQYSFAKHGIPSLFLFTGLHDDYHQPTDTIEKIDFEKLTKISRLAFSLLWRVANLEHRLEKNVDVP
ncbi:peptidase M28 [Chloroherpeton thalassium ATCC 35110]|uniref:Peptidase M28 n=1 Tax=Chloroherpeton thalassium (strain ATCC 35110 / GB-78) TaxID=517418 RepID=B3QVT1_CHLT3|nr:M20/M25/M40 family metallo-hydrolase [Chloroherpeton thalassium]ACF13138.1 peptidase M28 [Chloroherpeton thalassium ATCC 35110]